MSVLSELLTLASSLGCGTIGTNLFAQTLPVSPVVGTAVILHGGPMSGGEPTRSRSFQILHRNTSLASGTTFVTSLNESLRNLWNGLDTIQCRIEAVNEAGAFFYSGDRQPVFSLNYRMTFLSL